MEEEVKVSKRHMSLNLILTLMLLFLIWAIPILIILDVGSVMGIVEKTLRCAVMIPAIVIWTYVAIKEFRKYWRERNG